MVNGFFISIRHTTVDYKFADFLDFLVKEF